MTASLDLNNPFSPCEMKKIARLEFGVLDPDFLKNLSVCEVTGTELYEGGLAKPNSLNDTRMGTTDYRILCTTCNMDVKICPGHFGHLTLAKPMYHYGFLKIVLKVLRCVCYGCSRLLVTADDSRLRNVSKIKLGSKRLKKVFEVCAGKRRCEGSVSLHFSILAAKKDDAESALRDGCGCPQPKYMRDGPNITVQFQDNGGEYDENQEESKRLLTAEEAYSILKRISDEDMKLMGFHPLRSRPAWLILVILPISPPAVRPYVQFGSDRSEDDLTLKLLDIVKINNQLKRQEHQGASNLVLAEISQLLQYHITTMLDNDIPGVPVATTRSKKPIKSLRARLKGKEGRLRGNLMGKRVDFSARTVITGDPNMPIDVIGVPKSVAMTLTFSETVTPLNYDVMKKLVEAGPHVWPGAKYITRDDGTRFDLRHVHRTAEQQLEYGYRVERHMQDGDYILFNRQPSLHKMSIMGHTVKVLPYSTFRLNLSVTSPYNADFDGDEMNLHLAQSHETRAEIKHLMMVPKQIVSPQGNKPVMGIVQDALLGISKFTSRGNFLSRDVVMDLLMWIPYWDGNIPTPAILYPEQLWTGKQLISVLLNFDQTQSSSRVKINLQRDAGIARFNEDCFCYDTDSKVIIHRGEHLAGIICKRTVGSSSGSLIHVLWHEAGPERVKDFLSAVQKVVNNWLVVSGFSVGCSDIIANDSTLKKVAETLDKSKQEVQKLVQQAQKGKLECQPGKSLLESFESRVNKELNEARELSGKLVSESLDDRNNILAMVNAGSKGSTINISQIISCVGQQNVEGKRIPFGFAHRSLPHFIKHDYGPESRGFVSNSYLSGLTPQEMFFHAMGGREGIIDTACKTSETGYIQRRLIKAMEDVLVSYDRTVRNSLGDVLQFLYGEDAMNAEFVEDQGLDLIRIDNNNFDRIYKHNFVDESYGNKWILDSKIRSNIMMDYKQQVGPCFVRFAFLEYIGKLSILEEEYNKLKSLKEKLCREVFPDGSMKLHLPVNMRRLLEFSLAQFPATDSDRKRLNPVDIAVRVNHLIDEKMRIVTSTKEDDIISVTADENAKLLISSHLRSVLNSRFLMEHERMGESALEWLFGEVERQFNRALAHPGECVGAIAAQSIGEPATQMTLNTFHFAGVGSKNVTLGVPRLRELINMAKNVKTPSLTVYLDEKIANDQESAKDVQTQLEHTTLDKVTSYAQVYYDPDPEVTIVEEDQELVSDYYAFPDEEGLPRNLGPWLLRIVLTNKMMTEKKLTMKEIGERLYQEFSNDELDCIWTDDNSKDLVLRIRVKHPELQQKDSNEGGGMEAEDKFLQVLMGQCLANITFRGISNISKVYMREEGRRTYNEVTGKFERMNNWVLDTDGCNLEGVLPMPFVDATRTTSNSMTEIFKILGIEAVRRALLRELRTVISFDGSYVNYRHLAILCDTMTQKGHLIPITRHGINRIDRGPLMKCSFEETVEILLEAAAFAETDALRGVTENVILGQLAPLGTGDFDLLIDENKLKDANQNLDTIQDLAMEPFTSPETGLLVTPDGPQTPAPLSTIMSPVPFSPTYGTTTSIASPQYNQAGISHQQSRLDKSPQTAPMSPMSPIDFDTIRLGGKFSPVDVGPASPACMSPSSPIGDLPIESYTFGSENPLSPISALSRDVFSPVPYSPGPVFANKSPLMHSPTAHLSGGLGSIDSSGPFRPPYSPVSPPYSPNSSSYSPSSPTLPQYKSDNKRDSNRDTSGFASNSSPRYSPSSPVYSPIYSPQAFQPPNAAFSPTSAGLSVTSPRYSPTSPVCSPHSPIFTGPSSPNFNVQSPPYSPTVPSCDISSPLYNATVDDAKRYSPSSPLIDDPYSSEPLEIDPSVLDAPLPAENEDVALIAASSSRLESSYDDRLE
ncbi:Dna-directed Rna polymerase II RPB1 [Cardiosporidium cionae]|uniref:DNA-directed RNA polymerase subunit n=1 Tax=Cardiosporidium cionae TaxID=476202 RepID=A0ABQ7J9J3_9APIC|nr:Dna-directed Rna polymerase II RPB1 [Cardiosporidium cionae]|eukprot:KAF8820604.1 Dna-directed Rna polymerase II RPB1 [Cardiosporidium cionae]